MPTVITSVLQRTNRRCQKQSQEHLFCFGDNWNHSETLSRVSRPVHCPKLQSDTSPRYADARDNEYLKVMVKYDADAKVVIEDLVQLLHKQGNSYRAPPLRFPQIQNIYYANPSEIPSLLAVPEDKVHEEAQELAKKIQAAYRMYRKHHEAQARAVGKGSEAQRIAVYVACLRNVHASKWRKNSYRNLYLKALPYLVVCLDKVISIAHEFKKKTKGLLAKGDHERLEELGKQMSNIR